MAGRGLDGDIDVAVLAETCATELRGTLEAVRDMTYTGI